MSKHRLQRQWRLARPGFVMLLVAMVIVAFLGYSAAKHHLHKTKTQEISQKIRIPDVVWPGYEDNYPKKDWKWATASRTPTPTIHEPKSTPVSTPRPRPRATVSVRPVPKPSRTTPRPSPSSASAAPRVGKSAAEAEVFRLVNIERVKVGCHAVVPNSTLDSVARKHSANMAAQDNMSHDLDGKDAGDQMRAAGLIFSGWGENIARGYDTPAEVMDGWMTSPGHRENILDCSFTSLGVGMVQGTGTRGPWWTQDFMEV